MHGFEVAAGEAIPLPTITILDRDTKFSSSFDTIFNSEGINILPTPYQAPIANAFAKALGQVYVGRMLGSCIDLE